MFFLYSLIELHLFAIFLSIAGQEGEIGSGVGSALLSFGLERDRPGRTSPGCLKSDVGGIEQK